MPGFARAQAVRRSMLLTIHILVTGGKAECWKLHARRAKAYKLAPSFRVAAIPSVQAVSTLLLEVSLCLALCRASNRQNPAHKQSPDD